MMTADQGSGQTLLRCMIGSVLRRVRLRQGRTLRDVARAAGVSIQYLSELERGRKEASSEILAAICRALGLGLSELLDEVRTELSRLAPGPRPVTPRVPGSVVHFPSRMSPAAVLGTTARWAGPVRDTDGVRRRVASVA